MRARSWAGLAAFGVLVFASGWLYRDFSRRTALRELAPHYQRLAELRVSIFQGYDQRAKLLERWMGQEEFRKRRFALPRELTIQDDFDLFDIGQNQISEELARRLNPQRVRELLAIEESVSRTRAEYHALAMRVIDLLEGVGIEGRRPPTFALDQLLKSER